MPDEGGAEATTTQKTIDVKNREAESQDRILTLQSLNQNLRSVPK